MSTGGETDGIDDALAAILTLSKAIKDEGQAYSVLANLVAATSKINDLLVAPSPEGPSQRALTPPWSPSGALANLQDWIQKIKSALEAVAKFLDAASYSVGVSFPSGISVEISFNV